MNKLFLYSQRLTKGHTPLPLKRLHNDSDVVNIDSALLSYIFGNDPETGAPIGDLSVYLGDKASPEIKLYIEQNLLQPNMDNSSLSLPTDVINKMRSVITDDDIAYFTRNDKETREEYADRLRYYFDSERQKRREDKTRQTINDNLRRVRESIKH